MHLNRYLFLFAFLLPATQLFAAWILLAEKSWLTAISPILWTIGLTTVADYWVGCDTLKLKEKSTFLSMLPILALPVQLLMIMVSAYVWAISEFDLLTSCAWIVSTGFIASSFGITAAHELIHRHTKWQRSCGGLILASVCYGTFKVEHVYGHHVHVATPLDRSSAVKGQSVYGFIFKAIPLNILAAWQLAEQLRQRKSEHVWHNEVILWSVISLVFAIGLTVLWGPSILYFYCGQAFIAIVVLEIINYVEHYGLRRQKLDNDRFERVSVKHSWNSSYTLSNRCLFNLQRHSDHHTHATRAYYLLEHASQAPQLPGSYGAMMLLALVPPLWYLVIDPLIPS